MTFNYRSNHLRLEQQLALNRHFQKRGFKTAVISKPKIKGLVK